MKAYVTRTYATKVRATKFMSLKIIISLKLLSFQFDVMSLRLLYVTKVSMTWAYFI
jgi:hypothetical protein